MNHPCNASVYAVVPAYNESRRIVPVVTSLLGAGYQVIVVDDGSKDNTWELLRIPRLIRLRHPVNRGQGAALQTGITHALSQSADYIFTFDGDGQHSVDDIPRMLAPLKTGECDVTLGSRFLKPQASMPWTRRLVLRMGILFTGVVSGIWLTDTHNGFRAMTRSAAARIQISLDGMAHASEILDCIARAKLRYREVPVTVTYSQETLAKGQSSSNAVRIAFRFLTYLVTR